MNMTALPTRELLLERAATVPLAEMDVSHFDLFEHDALWPYFARLRREDPVHYHTDSRYGPYWSITAYDDIKAIDTDHERFSSEGSIGIDDMPADFTTPMFIAMDQPRHDEQRKAVSPIVGPKNLGGFERIIRERVINILDDLPVGETFNWVDHVSVELTTQMLATLFNFPFEERAKLTRWSDAATLTGIPLAQRREELLECLSYFVDLWHQRSQQEPGFDMISMLAHGEATKDMINKPMEFLGNIMLLIVGGNDTTRNSISGGVLALNQFPDQYQKLLENPDLIPTMVPEMIRWQTPVAHMARTALEDTELGGKHIKAGDRVAMWYISGNRDTDAIEDADQFIIDRARPRRHTSFGFGIHRCVGKRL
ncbi:MAG: cytochrome P450, partial [Pseudomonadales bacterium]